MSSNAPSVCPHKVAGKHCHTSKLALLIASASLVGALSGFLGAYLFSRLSKRTIVRSERAPPALAAYSQAIRMGNQVSASGCIGLDEKGNFAGNTVEEQTEQALKNLSAVLEAAGSSLAKVTKTTVLLRSMDDYVTVNAIYLKYFPVNPPARSCFAVAGLPKNALVEIEAFATL